MALYRIDGWDYYPDFSANPSGGNVSINALADGWYDATPQLTTFTGRFGKGLAIGINPSSFTFIGEAIGKRFTTETCVVGQAWYRPSGVGTTLQWQIIDGQGGNGVQFWLSFEDLGIIRLYRGGTSPTDSSGGTVVDTSAAKVWHEDEWNYIETKFLIHPTAGLVEVRVNKVVVISHIGPTQNTMAAILGQAPGWDSIGFKSQGVDPQVRWDDRYILDNTGISNNDYLGNVRVNCQLTTAPGDITQMSVFGAAANWDAVNERVLTEVEYVYDSVMGHYDLYTMDPNVTAQNILGVQITGAHRQDDSTQLKSNLLLKTGGIEYSGSDHFLAQTYHYYRDMWELNPNTGVGWTAAELNALQAGQKVLAG